MGNLYDISPAQFRSLPLFAQGLPVHARCKKMPIDEILNWGIKEERQKKIGPLGLNSGEGTLEPPLTLHEIISYVTTNFLMKRRRIET